MGAAELKTAVARPRDAFDELKSWKEKLGVPEIKTDVARLKDQADETKKDREKLGNRAWAILPNLIGALVNGFIAAAVAYFVAKK